ncbi:MAG: type II secretion system protein [Planctomycetes bacterium]|nr:type II secretion system protein [Planctomycetota bacterium]
MKRKGFTLVELLVSVAMFAILVTILLPSLGRTRSIATKKACQSNLSSIAKALNLYGGDYNDSFPWICSDSDTTCNYNFRSDMRDMVANDNFYTLLSSTSDNTNTCENLNMLVKRDSVSYKAFLCPAGPAKLFEDRKGRFGFKTSGEPKIQCQYGYHAGWKYSTKDGVLNSAALNENLSGDFIIMADMNPNKNTPFLDLSSEKWTHGKNEGVNILKYNASVVWSTTVNCDLGEHSLYMAGTTAASDEKSITPDVPLDSNDSVLYVSGQ